jgi:uncharacterized HAD superfamily protein
MEFFCIDAIRVINLSIMFADSYENCSSLLKEVGCPISDISESL